MDAKKCDRCGSFYTIDQLPKIRIWVSTGFYIRHESTKDWDLCPTCTDHILDYLTLSEEDKEGY